MTTERDLARLSQAGFWRGETDEGEHAIEDPRNQIFVSAISAWEITVKRLKGKMEAPDDLAVLVDEKGFTHLPLTFHHAELAARLPRHHKDPFDRFLIAQAQAEGLTVVTRDAHFPLYGVRTVRA